LVEAMRAGQDVIAALERVRRAVRAIASDDALSGPQMSALTLLGKNGAATTTALAAIEGVRSQSMSTTLAALEQKGLIERHADPNDGRRQIITLSAAGEAVFRDGRSARHAWLSTRIHSDLTVEQTQLLIEAAALLERLVRRP